MLVQSQLNTSRWLGQISATHGPTSSHVTLVSTERKRMVVPRHIAEQSKLIKGMLADDDDEDEMIEIPLPLVSAHTLEKVVEFYTYHTENNPMMKIAKPLKSNDLVELVGAWDAQFIDVGLNELFAIITVANYLELPELLDLSCAKLASLIRGKTPEQIGLEFGISTN